MICENCGKEFFEDWRKDKETRKTPCRFCCRECANARHHSENTKQKIKDGVKISLIKRGIKKKEKIPAPKKIKCQFCGKEISIHGIKMHEKACELNPNRIITHHSRKRNECREGYVYVITNIVNNKKYVGKHVGKPEDSKNYFGSGIAIKNAIKKYGKKNFIKEILEYNTDANLDEREAFWIDKLNTLNEGYNLTKGGDGGDTLSGRHWFTNGKINILREVCPEGFYKRF